MVDLNPDTHPQDITEQDTLTWEDSYAIALHLRAHHPDENLDDVSLGKIYRWTIELPEFQDDLALANDGILLAIYQEWIEEELSI